MTMRVTGLRIVCPLGAGSAPAVRGSGSRPVQRFVVALHRSAGPQARRTAGAQIAAIACPFRRGFPDGGGGVAFDSWRAGAARPCRSGSPRIRGAPAARGARRRPAPRDAGASSAGQVRSHDLGRSARRGHDARNRTRGPGRTRGERRPAADRAGGRARPGARPAPAPVRGGGGRPALVGASAGLDDAAGSEEFDKRAAGQ